MQNNDNKKLDPKNAQSEKEKIEIGKGRAEALAKYASSLTAETVVPPPMFLEFFLGLSKEEIEMIKEAQEAALLEEPPVTEEEEEIIEEEEPIRRTNR